MTPLQTKQQGIATILIVLLVGIVLTATTYGLMHTVKSSQNKLISAHAVTNAQGAAWMIAEATRRYLSSLDAAGVNTLVVGASTGNINIPFTPPTEYQHLSKSTINVTSAKASISDPKSFDINVNISAIDSNSEASSSINVVYSVLPSSSLVECPDSGQPFISGDVIGDKLDLRFDGAASQLLVDGKVGTATQDVSISGIKRIESTGDIFLKGTGNSSTIDLLKSNGHIFLSQSGSFGSVEAGGDLTTTSNPSINSALAGGKVVWGAAGGSQVVSIQAGVPYKTGTAPKSSLIPLAGTFTANHNANIKTVYSRDNAILNGALGNIGNIETLYSGKNIDVVGTSGALTNAIALGNITCTGTTIGLIQNAKAKAAGSKATCVKTPITLATNSDVPPPKVFDPVNLNPTFIADVDEYLANYAFNYDDANNKIIVTVKNVNGLADGKYELYEDATKKISNGLRRIGGPAQTTDFSLCTPDNDSNTCIKFTAGINIQPLNASNKSINGIKEIDQAKGVWDITNKTLQLAPGIYYFDRDLQVNPANESRLVVGFLSAGDISIPSSATNFFAINGIPAAFLCGNERIKASLDATTNQVTIQKDTSNPYITTLFKLQNGIYPYPTNFCSSSSTGPSKLPFIGQFSFMAGQENDATATTPTTYQGGDILVSTGSQIYGRVAAGNTLQMKSGANVDIYGSITAEARGTGNASAVNNLTGTVKVHTNYLDNLGAAAPVGACTKSKAVSGETKILWSRYL